MTQVLVAAPPAHALCRHGVQAVNRRIHQGLPPLGNSCLPSVGVAKSGRAADAWVVARNAGFVVRRLAWVRVGCHFSGLTRAGTQSQCQNPYSNVLAHGSYLLQL